MTRLLFGGVYTLLAILAALIFGPYVAHGHDEASWIMASPNFGWCCGERDCEVAPEGAIVEQEGGMFIPSTGQFFPYGDPAENLSTDDRYWWCRFMSGSRAGEVRCVFRPNRGI